MTKSFVLLLTLAGYSFASAQSANASAQSANASAQSANASAQSANIETGYVIIADSGKDNDGQAKVAQAMVDRCNQDTCTYGMLAGDIIYPAGMERENDPKMDQMFHKHYDQLGIQFLVALGNHDYGEIPIKWKRGKYALGHALLNENFYLPTYYYIKVTKNAVIAVIDTNRLFFYVDEQPMKDLLGLAYKTAKKLNSWFIVMGHHPYLSNGKHGNAGRYEGIPGLGYNIKKLIEKYICGKADFYVAGHEHLLQAFDGNVKGCDTQMIVSGAAASTTKIKRNTPALYQSAKLGFFHLLLSGDTATVKAIGEDNQLLYQATHTKKQKN